MRFGHLRVGFQLADQFVVGLGLLPCQIAIEDEQRNHADDGNIVGRGTDLPKLSPIHRNPQITGDRYQITGCRRTPTPLLVTLHLYFFGSFTSEASMTGAGPEMPPSFLTRQKCTIINTAATMGMP